MPGVTQIPPDALPPVDPDSAPASHPGVELMRALRETRALPGLIGLARDLAAWSETVAAESCDAEILADLEEFGRRAHELVRVMDEGGDWSVAERRLP